MEKADLIIIGAGPGGYRAADYAAKAGLSVIVIEKKHVGGTCLNEGCIPTKSFAHDAVLYSNPLIPDEVKQNVDLARIRQRKNDVVARLREGVEGLLAQPNITYIKGEARFVSEKVVAVNDQEYTAGNIIIATGSTSRLLPFAQPFKKADGSMQYPIVTSTELLDADHVPARLAVIGAGVIGLEFASAFGAFGSEVTVIEFLKECLPPVDSEIAKRLRKGLEKQGIIFHMQSAVTEITLTDDATPRAIVTFDKKGKQQTVEADMVLVATGREVCTDGLNLEAAGIDYDKKGIKVDNDMQTNVKGVYAIGDVNGIQMLAHASTFQGLHVVNRILGRTDNIKLNIMPAAIFTNPEAACVGLTEDACKEAGIAYTVKKGYHRSNGRALAVEATEGMMKLMIGSDSRIIGCHVYGAHAADIVQEVSVLMDRDTTLQQMRELIHIHPTMSEIFQDAII